jgi:hypothetical protein
MKFNSADTLAVLIRLFCVRVQVNARLAYEMSRIL